jgi:uncharacterized repeat protein (TIGR01451 family)
MAQAGKARRARWLMVGLLTTALVAVGSIAAGIALTGGTDEIVLVLDGEINEFQYGGDTQLVTLGLNECSVAASSLGGPIMEISATTFTKQGRVVDPAPIGLVEDGMGVNEKGTGNGQNCGRVDVLDGGETEALTLSLGSLITGQMISSVDFDFEAKFDARVRVDFLRGTSIIDTKEFDLSEGSDSGPDSKFRDKYSVSASTEVGLFDGVSLSMVDGGVALEGGATWEYSNESPDDHRTVFHLVDANPDIAIDVSTNGDDADSPTGPNVEVGDAVTWTYVVTNPGDLALGSVSVSDDQGASPVLQSGDVNGDGLLDTTETWIYSASGTAVAGQYSNTGSVSADSLFGETVTASDPSHYFGSAPGVAIDVQTNGPGESPSDGPYIDSGDAVTWTYTVTNTGNVTLTGVSVTDSETGAVSGCDATIAPSASSSCTESGTAEVSPVGEPYTNTGSATGTPPVGADASHSDSSSYFGSNPSIAISVTNNGPVVVTGDDIVWDFTVTNTGNVPLVLVAVTEDGTVRCELGTVAPGDTATCQYSAPAEGGPQSTTFTAEGTDPLGDVTSEASGTVGYFGGLDCGDSTTEGGPGLADSPRVAFSVGPNSKDIDCAVPVEITSSSTPGGDQEVNIGPPDGFDWDGVTGIVTIEWDEEAPDLDGVGRTFQRTISGDTVIPWCVDVVVGINQVAGEWFYELIDPNALYPDVTAGGDVCLIFQNTVTVDDGGTIFTQTTETFYIWNDPRLAR